MFFSLYFFFCYIPSLPPQTEDTWAQHQLYTRAHTHYTYNIIYIIPRTRIRTFCFPNESIFKINYAVQSIHVFTHAQNSVTFIIRVYTLYMQEELYRRGAYYLCEAIQWANAYLYIFLSDRKSVSEGTLYACIYFTIHSIRSVQIIKAIFTIVYRHIYYMYDGKKRKSRINNWNIALYIFPPPSHLRLKNCATMMTATI